MIWLIGGTSNAIEMCRRLVTYRLPLLVTVTTGYGELLAQGEGVEVLTGALTSDNMAKLIIRKKISLIVDASHPFAYEVSKNAMAVAEEASIPYLRFERKTNDTPIPAVYADSYSGACQYLHSTTGNVLLTTGSKNISDFVSLGVERLFARVLPVPAGLDACKNAGIDPSHIIAAIGPFSSAFNRAMIEQYNIAYLVTKDSGNEGGFPEKIDAAVQAGITAVVIRRPALQYPEVYSEYESIIGRIMTIAMKR